MANYNFFNVDAHEFEEICSEVLSIYLGIKMRTFPEGRDRGIDIKRTSGEEDIIGQCKRIQRVTSCFTCEFNKIKEIKACKKYYLFIACEITSIKRTEIFNRFVNYMEDESFIFDAKDLNGFLEQSVYQSVVRNHFKLWITSEKLFSHFLNKVGNFDSYALLDSIKEHRKYFVKTEDYKKIINTLLNKRIVLITGQPGVGKSTLSEMAILTFIDKHPKTNFVYSSSGDLDQIKKGLSENKNAKELIYIDDFLGDYYLDLKTGSLSSISSFINAIRVTNNKYLIINSRILILNEAREKSLKFQNSIDLIEESTVEIKKLTEQEKGEILFNHLYFSDISDECKQEILENKRYWNLINHPNYNPRLIEYIANSKLFTKTDFASYYDFVMNSLNKAEKIWSDAIKNNLAEVDRLFLITMKSFGQNQVKYEVQKKAFEHVICFPSGVDHSINHFEECVKRLNGSFVFLSKGKDKYFSFLNPSIKESVVSDLPRKTDDYVAFEQFYTNNFDFLKSELFYKMCFEGGINKLLLNSISIHEAYLLFFANFDVCTPIFRKQYVEALLYRVHGKNRVLDTKVSDIYKKVFTKKYIDFYCVCSLGDNEIARIINNLFDVYYVLDAINALSLLMPEKVHHVINDCYLSEKFADVELSNINLNVIINNHISDGDSFEFDEDGAKEEIKDALWDRISDSYYIDELKSAYDFDLDKNEIGDSVDSLVLNQVVEDFLADMNADMELDRYKEELAFVKYDVDEMFSHLLD